MENLEQNQPTGEKAVPEPKPKSSPLFMILLSLLMFVLGGASVYAYFTFLKPGKMVPQPVVSPSPVPTPIPSPTPTPTIPADWQTYRNEEYGFEIKYPSNWKLGESVSNGYPYIRWLDPIAQQITLPQTEIDEGALVQIYMKDASKYAVQPVTPSTLKDIFLSMDMTKGLYSDPEATQQVNEETLGNLNGVRQSTYSKYERGETFTFIKEYHTETVVFEVSISVYKPLENHQKTEGYVETFNLILQTFKFTE